MHRFKKLRRHRRLKRGLIFLALIGINCVMVFGIQRYHNYQNQKLKSYPIRGVTVSQQNSYVDFVSLASIGEKFVYIRATQGSIYTDDDFADNYQRSQGSGLNVGVYHSFSFSSSVKNQFTNFSGSVENDIGILPIAIQININEASLNAKQVKSVRQFINLIQQRYDRRVVIWTTQRIYEQVRFGNQLCLFWSLNNDLKPKTIALKTYNSNQTLKNDGQNQQFIQNVFVGTNQQWQAYIRPHLSKNGGTISEN